MLEYSRSSSGILSVRNAEQSFVLECTELNDGFTIMQAEPG